jgi:hypothetical protein
MCSETRGSSVGIVTGYELDGRGSAVRFPAGAGNVFSLHRVKTLSGGHPASHPMDTGFSFPEGEAAGA